MNHAQEHVGFLFPICHHSSAIARVPINAVVTITLLLRDGFASAVQASELRLRVAQYGLIRTRVCLFLFAWQTRPAVAGEVTDVMTQASSDLHKWETRQAPRGPYSSKE